MILNPSQSVGNLKGDLGGSVEQSIVNIGTPDTGSFFSFLMTMLAGASIVHRDYLHWTLPNGDKVAAWFNLTTEDDTAPSGALYTAADIKIAVVIDPAVQTTAALVATEFDTAVAAGLGYAGMTRVKSSADITVTSDSLGAGVTPVGKTFDDGSDGAIVPSVLAPGTAAALQNTFLPFENEAGDPFYLWFNVNSEGVDPSETGTAVEVALDTADLPAAILTAMASAVNGMDDFVASNEGSVLSMSTKLEGDAVDISEGDTGFTVSVRTQGKTEKFTPAMSVGSLTNDPSAF